MNATAFVLYCNLLIYTLANSLWTSKKHMRLCHLSYEVEILRYQKNLANYNRDNEDHVIINRHYDHHNCHHRDQSWFDQWFKVEAASSTCRSKSWRENREKRAKRRADKKSAIMGKDKRGLAFEFKVLGRVWVWNSFSLISMWRRQMNHAGGGFVVDVPSSLAHFSATAALACCLLLPLYFLVSLRAIIARICFFIF